MIWICTVQAGQSGVRDRITNAAHALGDGNDYCPSNVIIGQQFSGSSQPGEFVISQVDSEGVVWYFTTQQVIFTSVDFPETVRPMLTAIWDALGNLSDSINSLSGIVAGSVLVQLATLVGSNDDISEDVERLTEQVEKILANTPKLSPPSGGRF